MKNKINVAEILKDCPRDMELDCVLSEDVILDGIDMSSNYPIKIIIGGKQIEYLSPEGCLSSIHYTNHKKAKCVIFPKGKTTWEGFVSPYKFKDGDVCYVKTKMLFEHIIIFKVSEDYNYIQRYVNLSANHLLTDKSALCTTDEIMEMRFATEEEKQKLFNAIKENGYKWNEETKTLEKLVEPKFKVGDKVQWKEDIREKRVIDNVLNNCYTVQGYGVILFDDQDEWELVFKHKFKVGDRIIHKESGIYCTIGEYIESFKGYNTNIGGFVVRYNDIDNWELYPLPNKFDITTFKPFIITINFMGVVCVATNVFLTSITNTCVVLLMIVINFIKLGNKQ